MWFKGISANSWYPLTCSDGVWDPEKWHASLYPASGRSSPVESVKKELDTDRPSLVRRIVGEHAVTQKWGQQFWRQCSLLLASFLAVSVLCIEGKCHYQETDLPTGFFSISRVKS